MLHVLNGDATATPFRQAQLPGEIVVWREILSEGPADYRRQERSFWAARQAYITQTYGVSATDYHQQVIREMARLQQHLAGHEEIVLWFEHDLLCQVNLLYLVHWFSSQDLAAGQLQVVCIDRHPGHPRFRGLGELSPEQLAGLFPYRKAVTPEEQAFARQAWQAYTAPDPTALLALPAMVAGLWQFLPPALEAHRQRFPARLNGLNRIETLLLQILEKGPATSRELFAAFWEEAAVFGLGDAQLQLYLAPLAAAGLVSPAEPWTLTPRGRAVLAGEQHFGDLYPRQRWLGGVRLAPGQPGWHWNPHNNRLTPA